MTLIHVLRVSSRIFLVSCLAFLLMASTSQAVTLYWDANGNSAGFGNGGTWGTDSFWTTDSSGNFSDFPGTATTTSGDVVHINEGNVGGFSMGVAGSVQALRIETQSTASPFATINGPGTINLYSSGAGASNALIFGNNDLRMTVNPNLVLEATGGSTVYLADQGGNNSNITLNGSITSTNTVNLFYRDPGHLTINGNIDLQGGTFGTDSGGGFQIRNHTLANGVLGSGVGNVERYGVQGGHGTAGDPTSGNKGRLVLGADNAYTGDTILDTSIIRLTANTSLPSTTSVFITNNGAFMLDFTGTNIISGLSIDGVALGDGVYGSGTHTNFTGTGSLTVISAAPVPEPRAALLLVVGLLGLAAVRWRRR